MAKVANNSNTLTTSATASWVVSLPPHVSGDILLIFCGNDYNTNNYGAAPSGWSKGTAEETGNTPAAFYYTRATSSSTANPTITSAGSNRIQSCPVVVVRGAPSSAYISTQGSTTTSEAGGATHSVTPSDGNTLILEWLVSGAGNRELFPVGDSHVLSSVQVGTSGSGYTNLLMWHFHEPSSTATTTHGYGCNFGSTDVAKITVSIKDDGTSGLTPGQVSPYSAPCTLISPLTDADLSAYDDATKRVDPTLSLITAIKSTAPTYKAIGTVARPAQKYIPTIHCRGHNVASSGDWSKYLVGQDGFSGTFDLSSDSIVSFSVRGDQDLPPNFETGGRWLGLGSGDATNVATAAKLWMFEAEDSKQKSADVFGVQTYAIDVVNGTAAESYSSLSNSAVTKWFAASYHTSSSMDMGLNFLYQHHTLIGINGGTGSKLTYQDFANFTQSNHLFTVKNQGGVSGAAFFAFHNVQIGDGTRSLNFDGSYQLFEFPPAYDEDSRSIAYNIGQSALTHSVYAPSGGAVDYTSGTFNGGDLHNWEIHTSSANENIYIFTNYSVLNAGVTLRAKSNINFANMLFSGCEEITHNSASTTGGITIDNTVSTEDCGYRIQGSTQALLQTAIDNIANSNFTNNTSTSALRIEFSGTGNVSLNVDAITFSGNDVDVHYQADNTSALTLVMQNGATGSSSAVSDNATGVTFSNDVTFTINITPTGSEVTLLETGTQTEVDHEETATTTYTYTYTYSSDQTIDISVFKEGYAEYWSGGAVTLGNADQSITVDLEEISASQN